MVCLHIQYLEGGLNFWMNNNEEHAGRYGIGCQDGWKEPCSF